MLPPDDRPNHRVGWGGERERGEIDSHAGVQRLITHEPLPSVSRNEEPGGTYFCQSQWDLGSDIPRHSPAPVSPWFFASPFPTSSSLLPPSLFLLPLPLPRPPSHLYCLQSNRLALPPLLGIGFDPPPFLPSFLSFSHSPPSLLLPNSYFSLPSPSPPCKERRRREGGSSSAVPPDYSFHCRPAAAAARRETNSGCNAPPQLQQPMCSLSLSLSHSFSLSLSHLNLMHSAAAAAV